MPLLLKKNPDKTRRKLSATLGISTGSTHYALKVLIDKYLVKLGNFKVPEDKRRYAYVFSPKCIATRAAMTGSFLAGKTHELEVLNAEIVTLSDELEATEVGSFKLKN